VKRLLRMLPALRAFFISVTGAGSLTDLIQGKNAIQAAKNEFSKVNYLKNLFQYYTVSA
jgi:hypothetical protein